MKNQFIKFLLLVMAGAISFGCRCGSGESNNQPAPNNQSESKKQPKKVYDNYQAAVKDGDFESAYRFLNNYHEEFLSAISKCCVDNGKVKARDKEKYFSALLTYFDAFDYIYKAEIRLILTTMEGQEAADKISFLLYEIPIDGTKYHDGEEVEGGYSYRDDDYRFFYMFYNTSRTWIQHFNGLCDHALDLAINRGNRNVAQQVLMHYADNVDVKKVGYDHYVNYTNTDFQKAQKKYNEAESMGKFK